MEEKKTAEPQTPDEEIFDEELKKLLGDRYQDATAVPTEYEPMAEAEKAEGKSRWGQIKAAVGLIAGVGLLLYMVMTGKIDTAYGVLFVAGVSAACGYRMN